MNVILDLRLDLLHASRKFHAVRLNVKEQYRKMRLVRRRFFLASPSRHLASQLIYRVNWSEKHFCLGGRP